MQITKILLIATILSIIPGQIIRLPIFSQPGALTITDIFVFTTNAVFLIYYIPLKRRIELPKPVFVSFLLFTLSAALSTVLALNHFSPADVVISSLFLLRFIMYFLISVITLNLVKKVEIQSWVKFIIFTMTIFLILGFIQFFIYPDLTNLVTYGWDPHQMRIVSTFLDPNFAGALLCILFAFSLGLYLFNSGRMYLLLAVFVLIGILLTYSRSSYLNVITIITILGIVKSPKLFLTFLITFVIIFFQFSRIRDRVIGALTIDETAKARIESWKNATVIIGENLTFGVGFNTYRYAQASHGFFTTDDPLGGHSGGGVDSSFLLVVATGGLTGLSFFLIFVFSVIRSISKNLDKDYLRLSSFAVFLGVIVHTQFVNSFFFPQIMLILWFILGLNLVYDN